MKTAVVASGGHQYLVTSGQIIEVEKLAAKENEVVKLDCLLLVDGNKVTIGQPLLKRPIEARVIKTEKGKKVRVGKFKAKSRYRKVKGHRQTKTTVKITDKVLLDNKAGKAKKSAVLKKTSKSTKK